MFETDFFRTLLRLVFIWGLAVFTTWLIIQ